MKQVPFFRKKHVKKPLLYFHISYLIYYFEIWRNTNDTHLNPIIKIQKKGKRAISFAHYLDPTTPLVDRLNILNFKNLITKIIALLMFKHNMGRLPHPITDLFALNKE